MVIALTANSIGRHEEGIATDQPTPTVPCMEWVDRHWGWWFGLMVVSTALVIVLKAFGA